MKNKKVKPSKGVSNRKRVLSDVSPSSSIPPLVEGQLRCFLRVTVSKVLWTITRPPPVTLIRLRWWGESSSGTFFRPRDGHAEQKGVKSTARFPVRCGPKQLTSYLTDMGSLVLDVLTKVDHLPIARVQIPGIARLSLSHSINGYFTLVSPSSEKLGELQVTLALEALTEAYDSSSSLPTTDMSLDTQAPGVTTHQNIPAHSSLHQPLLSVKETAGSSSGNMPRGKDYLYFQENSNVIPDSSTGKPEPASTQTNRHAPVDLLSVLLERGSKLRNAMVVSALKSDVESDVPLKDIPLPLSKDNTDALPARPSSGQFLENILQAEHQHPVHYLEEPGQNRVNPEDMAVDLLLGSVNGSVLHFWDGEGSFPDSLSDHSSVLMESELNDPQYDQSLLENLFYKAPISDECLEEEHQNKDPAEKPVHTRPTKNAQLDSEDVQHSEAGDDFSGLSMEEIALLGDIRFARVTISELKVSTESISRRPPRPLTTRKCFYIIEYLFPLVSAGFEDVQLVPSEITKAVSSKVTEGVVMFQHQGLFPVRFSRSSVKQWWEMNVTFKIYSRNSLQKTPVLIGSAMFPLSSLMQSESLSISAALPVQTADGNIDKQAAGPLKVSFELAADKNDFSTKKRPAKGMPSPARPPPSRLTEEQDGPKGSCVTDHRRDPSPSASVHQVQSILIPPSRSRSTSPHVRSQSSLHGPLQREVEETEILLHMLLMVPEGKDFNCAPMQPNIYLNCKLLGSDETARSTVSWGQKHPSFGFIQVAPVTLTGKLLERMKNNMMVIEVWLRASSSDHDKLLGLVKLPLHQFYMSFREPKITELLLQSQCPVVGVDSFMPVVDVFSGSTRGHLRVCLAMGLAQQITALQRMRDDGVTHGSPAHMLDHRPHAETKASTTLDVLREHVFMVRVERVKGLTPLQSTVWGEADCYIQYSFPALNESREDTDPHVVESNVELKAYRTETTLCMPDPVFGHNETHVLLAPPDVPVQRILLSSLASQGLRNGGGVQFEVWCRYYYPNVRDQLVARGLLPMAKLCAMVTMQKQGQTDAHLFSLPLVPRTDRPVDTQPQPPGLLEVSVQYKSRPMRSVGVKSGVVPSRGVMLVIQVHRAAGLQAAAKALADADSSLLYYSEVGLNSFITVQLSFLPDSEVRSTRVVARSFCPEFEHHAEFCCNLLVQRDSGESVSLAELLQGAVAVFTVYNRDTRKMADTTRSKDTVLGTVKIRLADLISKRSGISGWYSLSLPPSTSSSHSLTSAGGLEVSISFSHHADRERVVSSARGLGWDVGQDSEDEADIEDEDTLEESTKSLALSLSMPRAWLPIHCLLLPGHEDLQRSTYCYYRYKLYNRQTFCSELTHPVPDEREGEEGLATVAFQGSKSVVLRRTQALRWYLREEKLEVQVWVAFGKEKRVRPNNADRLVGSAFVDLSALAGSLKHHQTISGVYPLFKRSAVNLSGAALRVHITVTTDSVPHEPQATEELTSPVEDEEDGGLPATALSRPSQSPSKQLIKSTMNTEAPPSKEITNEDTFIANITVDRAMHLSLKGCPLAERGGGLPSCCVSYAIADAPGTVTTALIKDSDCPIWDHQQECRLSKELLLDPQQSLVFKVWHKGEVERVIGFVSVDLSPLLSGFQSVCGWYNITDFSGQCQGQLKVSVSPLRAVQEFRAQRLPAHENAAPDSSALFSALPLSYQTTATYSSFPSHISRFSEQRISTPPDQIERLLSDRYSVTDRHDEHMDNIRMFHQSLHEEEKASQSSLAGDSHPSSSALFSVLRKNLSELDDIQRYFSRKLSTPAFPKLNEPRGTSRLDEHRDSESDTTQLLLKSSQLVGEVNNIIKGLSEHQTEEATTSHKSSASLDVVEEHLTSGVDQLISSESDSCETEPRFHKESDMMSEEEDEVWPVSSPAPAEIRQSPAAAEDEKLHQRSSDHSSDEEDCVDEDEHEDFEETLIQPRTLNEVTSVTDRTSPWTSLLSDPDMGSLESLEFVQHHAHDDTIHTQGEERKSREILPDFNPQSLTGESQAVDSDSDIRERSETDLDACRSDGAIITDHREQQPSLDGLDGDGALSSISEVEDCEQSNSAHEESDESPNLPLSAESGSETSEESDERTAKPLESVEIPNFFLSAHHLEASMRALRMAPVFPSATTESETVNPGSLYRRVPRSRPSIPPSQRSEETRRIAKIFASKFTEGS
ncbi:C2 domain-containing protein 3-like [Carassius auratus]|uniref:C2 domain-containing protein 3-like n=1 Tax=Carassius auratus TaxID=7957 RepID=A0A6P6QYA4_CARAU|nr:C2 domain-containing protein 3-like [Carassius auratus]